MKQLFFLLTIFLLVIPLSTFGAAKNKQCGDFFDGDAVKPHPCEPASGDPRLVCSTNEFQTKPYTVCLIARGQKCSNDAECEGGTYCIDTFCMINTGEDTLSGIVGNATTDIRPLFRTIINILLGFLGTITVLLIMYGGMEWILARGNEEKIEKGKNVVIWAIIGAIVISIAWTISSYLLNVGQTV